MSIAGTHHLAVNIFVLVVQEKTASIKMKKKVLLFGLFLAVIIFYHSLSVLNLAYGD